MHSCSIEKAIGKNPIKELYMIKPKQPVSSRSSHCRRRPKQPLHALCKICFVAIMLTAPVPEYVAWPKKPERTSRLLDTALKRRAQRPSIFHPSWAQLLHLQQEHFDPDTWALQTSTVPFSCLFHPTPKQRWLFPWFLQIQPWTAQRSNTQCPALQKENPTRFEPPCASWI